MYTPNLDLSHFLFSVNVLWWKMIALPVFFFSIKHTHFNSFPLLSIFLYFPLNYAHPLQVENSNLLWRILHKLIVFICM